MTPSPHELLDFWFRDVGPNRWYGQDPDLDAEIRARFGTLWETGRSGGLEAWRTDPGGCLALVILLDQFPRNMFRGSALAFASDAKALSTCKHALSVGKDRALDLPDRSFLYMPLMHSESAPDQDRSVRLFLRDFGHGEMLRHAQAHRLVIRRFGRFPYRNAALGRSTTPAEAAFLGAGAYAVALAEVAAGA